MIFARGSSARTGSNLAPPQGGRAPEETAARAGVAPGYPGTFKIERHSPFFRVRDHSHGEHRSTPHVTAASLSPSFPFRPHPTCGSTAVVASLIFESRWDVQRQFQSAFSTPNHENIDITTRMVFSGNLVRHIINSATYRFVRPPDAPTRLNPK